MKTCPIYNALFDRLQRAKKQERKTALKLVMEEHIKGCRRCRARRSMVNGKLRG